MGLRISLDDVEGKIIFPLPRLELQLFGNPTHSQPLLLHRLCYLGSLLHECHSIKVKGRV
jgi:hypothetical protein